ncbi:hypothetical protein EDS67_27580 [candidate division KSB1 bacterium]|nr:MAG: hypothetical protein EDS67_27580 [candidate division KSB1 bacterium]MCE7945363.1 hypothetical protein [Chlorobi bacterium CHB1]MDL1876047.1 hypothetical protein [Cytophagia bacterium CHB2]
MIFILHICFRLGLVTLAVAMLFAITPQQKLETMLNILPATMGGKPMLFMTLPFSDHRVFVSAYHFPGLLLALIFVLFLCARTGRAILAALARNKKAALAGTVSLFIFLFTLTPRPPVIGGEISWYTVVYLLWGSLCLGLLLHGLGPLVQALNQRKHWRQMLIRAWNKAVQVFLGTKPAIFLGILFLIFFTLTNLASYFLFEHIPHVMDSIAQVFHAKIFALGKLTVPSPVHREFFDLKNLYDQSTIINNGKWYSQYPPGHSFLLMLGVLFDAPWIINPLLGSLTIVMLYFLGKELYGEKTARLTAVLGVLSPFIFFMSSEFMNHASTLFFFVSCVFSFAKAMRNKKIGYALLCGASLGMIIIIRPLTAVALAIPFSLYSLCLLLKRFREHLLLLGAMATMILVFVGITLWFNFMTNGDPFLFGYIVLYGPDHMPGFGHAAWGDAHTPAIGLRKTLMDLNGLNKFLFEWPVPSLLFVFVLFASFSRNKWDYLLLMAFISLTAAYFFYWFHQWCFGPRFLYESAAALIVLTARGILRLPTLFRKIPGVSISTRNVSAATAAFVALCVLIAAIGNIPSLTRYYGHNFANVNAEILKTVKEKGIKKAIIFTPSYYGNVLSANSPLLDTDIIYARDLGEKNHLLMSAFPDYEYYLADGSNIQLLEAK